MGLKKAGQDWAVNANYDDAVEAVHSGGQSNPTIRRTFLMGEFQCYKF